MQKHVKELIGQEMSAQLYPLLFDQIRGIVEKFFDQQGQVRPVRYHFFHLISVRHCMNVGHAIGVLVHDNCLRHCSFVCTISKLVYVFSNVLAFAFRLSCPTSTHNSSSTQSTL